MFWLLRLKKDKPKIANQYNGVILTFEKNHKGKNTVDLLFPDFSNNSFNFNKLFTG